MTVASYLGGFFRKLDLKGTFKRFPLPVIVSVLATILSILFIHRAHGTHADELAKMLALLGCCFWGGLAVCLLGEGRQWPITRKVGFSMLLFVVIYLMLALTSSFWIVLAFLLPSLIIAVAIAPYIGLDVDEKKQCHYNTGLLVHFVFAELSSLILGLGAISILASVNFLFDVKIPGRLYADAWILSSVCFASLYFLSHLESVEQHNREEIYYPKGVEFIVSYLLSPLVLIYTAILYAYVVKILLQGELPKGQLVYMITGYGIVGVATQLFSAPLVERGALMPTLIARYFYPLLWVPVALLSVAITMRVSEYGITEQRYAVLLATVWLAFTAIYMSLSRGRSLRVVLASLALLLFLASFGPWNAIGVSTRSQKAIFAQLLADNQLLSDKGTAIKAASREAVNFEDVKRLSSVLEYFISRGRLDTLRDVLPEEAFESNVQKYQRAQHVMETALGLPLLNRWSQPSAMQEKAEEGRFAFRLKGYRHVNEARVMEVKGYEKLLHPLSAWKPSKAGTRVFTDEDIKVFAVGTNILVKNSKGDELKLEMEPLIEKLRKEYADNVRNFTVTGVIEDPEDFMLTEEQGDLRAKLILVNIGGYEEDGRIQIEGMDFSLLVSLPEEAETKKSQN